MEYFDLTKHLGQKLVLNFLEYGFSDSLPRAHLPLIFFRLSDLRLRVSHHINVLQLEDLAVRTLPLVDSLSIFECNFKLTKKADKFVAIKALFWPDWNFSANHTRRLFDEIFLELVGRDIGVAWKEELDLER